MLDEFSDPAEYARVVEDAAEIIKDNPLNWLKDKVKDVGKDLLGSNETPASKPENPDKMRGTKRKLSLDVRPSLEECGAVGVYNSSRIFHRKNKKNVRNYT